MSELSNSQAGTSAGISILFVDDEAIEHALMAAKFETLRDESVVLHCVSTTDAAVSFFTDNNVDVILLDNRLFPEKDFRESVPKFRKAGFTGPIGITSSAIEDKVIGSFLDYGADFRIAKDEIDANALRFIISEYSFSGLPDGCEEDFL